ncbi:MAG: hypothetical protein QOH71_1369 [Blastocatellia bacterium]|jgi:hypothetical protein|nr:hypothetical protein [Blastocatellia bacterium]
MGRTLDEVRELLSTKYLGKAGIHSVGISRAENAVRVYVQPEAEDELKGVLKEIEREAAPYKVVPVKSDRSSIT